jgi:hypothetical protein
MRSGFIGNAENLIEQVEWRGLKLMPTGTRDYARYIDEPQRQLGAFIMPPDPVGLTNARPEPYAIDEYWPRLFQGGQPRMLQGGLPRYLQVSKYYDTN